MSPPEEGGSEMVKGGRWPAVALVLALVAAGCGRSGGGGTASTTAAPATSAPATNAGPGDFGTLKGVCGPGDARGATDKGVTDTTIDIGTMADPGATVSPGLDVELFDTAKAFVAWCNAAGGILGRKIVLHLLDAALFNVAARMIESCARDFAQVGSGTAFDDSGVATRLGCNLPQIAAYTNSPKANDAGLQVHSTPNPTQEDSGALFNGFAHRFPGERRVGLLVGNLASVVVTKNRLRETAQNLGFQVVYDATYPITGLANAESYVQQMRAAGVQAISQIGDVHALVQLEKAFQTVGWYPDAVVEAANVYDQLLIHDGGSAIKNTWVSVGYVPFEAAARNPATQQYLDLMHRFNPAGKVASLGLNAWSAWLLFAVAAKGCGSQLTRACLLQQAGAQRDWTAGGIEGRVPSLDPATARFSACNIVLQATPSGFVIDPSFLPPTDGLFNCDPRNVVDLKGHYSD